MHESCPLWPWLIFDVGQESNIFPIRPYMERRNTPATMERFRAAFLVLSQNVCIGMTVALVCGVLQGCQSGWMPMFGSPSMGSGMPPPQLRPPPIVVKTPDANWDVGVLELHDFIPAGARVIETGAIYPETFEDGIAHFSPKEQQSSHSPHSGAHLSLDNVEQTKGKGLWLVLRSKGTQISEPIFPLDRRIEVLWSPVGDKFAVNHWADATARDVFVVTIGDAQRIFFDLTPLLNLHFPSEGLSLRRTAKAQRWTTSGDLVIRSLFQRMEEPFSVFGCEVQIDFSGGSPSLTMLRGFIKE